MWFVLGPWSRHRSRTVVRYDFACGAAPSGARAAPPAGSVWRAGDVQPEHLEQLAAGAAGRPGGRPGARQAPAAWAAAWREGVWLARERENTPPPGVDGWCRRVLAAAELKFVARPEHVGARSHFVQIFHGTRHLVLSRHLPKVGLGDLADAVQIGIVDSGTRV